MEDVDVGTLAQLCCHLLFGGRLVADQTDDQVLRVFGDALEESKLGQIRQEAMGDKAGRTHADSAGHPGNYIHSHVE